MSGSMSGMWKRGTVWIMRHRQTKGPDTDRPDLNNRVTSRLYSLSEMSSPRFVLLQLASLTQFAHADLSAGGSIAAPKREVDLSAVSRQSWLSVFLNSFWHFSGL